MLSAERYGEKARSSFFFQFVINLHVVWRSDSVALLCK